MEYSTYKKDDAFALMQPYFFPYIGYFSLIHSVSHFMFFDTVKFSPKSWMCRNRILDFSGNNWIYASPATLIKYTNKLPLIQVQLLQTGEWQQKLKGQLLQYKSKAPFFRETMAFLETNLFASQFQTLVDLNIKTTSAVAAHIGLNTIFSQHSKFNKALPFKPHAYEWGCKVSEQVGAKTYLNARDGEHFIPSNQFTAAGIKLGFIQPNLLPYSQKNQCFMPGLSILDMLMWNGRDRTGELVKSFSIKWMN